MVGIRISTQVQYSMKWTVHEANMSYGKGETFLPYLGRGQDVCRKVLGFHEGATKEMQRQKRCQAKHCEAL